MQFISRPPRHPALAPFVRKLWSFTGDLEHAAERLLPSTRGQLLVNLREDRLSADPGCGEQRFGGAVLAGPRATPLTIGTAQQRHVVGVDFAEAGLHPFVGMPLGHLADLHIEAGDVWGQVGQLLRERLLSAGDRPEAHLDVLERALLNRFTPGDGPPPLLSSALSALSEGATVTDVSRQLGLTPRRLIELFQQRVGLTPKRYARVTRLNRLVGALQHATGRGWAELALAHGYCDQAHLTREFRNLAGLTPTQFVPRSSEALTHVPVAIPGAGKKDPRR